MLLCNSATVVLYYITIEFIKHVPFCGKLMYIYDLAVHTLMAELLLKLELC